MREQQSVAVRGGVETAVGAGYTGQLFRVLAVDAIDLRAGSPGAGGKKRAVRENGVVLPVAVKVCAKALRCAALCRDGIETALHVAIRAFDRTSGRPDGEVEALTIGRPAQIAFKTLIVSQLRNRSAVGGDRVDFRILGALQMLGDGAGDEGDGAAASIDLDELDGQRTAGDDGGAFGQRLLIGCRRGRCSARLRSGS